MLRSMIYMIHHRLSLLYNKLYVTEHNMNSLVSHRSINFAKREKMCLVSQEFKDHLVLALTPLLQQKLKKWL